MKIAKKTTAKIISSIFALNFLIPQVFAYGSVTLTPQIQVTQQISATQETTQEIEPAVAAFKDVPVGADHYVAIKYLKDHKIIDGYEDGNFKALNQINRAEALKIILGAMTKPPKKLAPHTDDATTQEISTSQETSTKTFSDVPSSAWFAPFIQQGIENEIVSGYPNGKFQPEQGINKVEALKMILLQAGNTLPVEIKETPYSDVPTDAWFAPYAQISKDRGLLLEDRKAGALTPDDVMNRGQFAELIYHFLQSNNGYRFGRATYYSDILAGRGTSSGDPYRPGVFTVAHKTLPFGTRLLVTNLANGESVEVKVNDRGPYATGVELDLSKSAFAAIASTSAGIIYTQYQIL